jgi:hypothetical protein
MMADSLGIPRLPIGELMKHILIRHDIVHRGGKTKKGEIVAVSAEDLSNLRQAVTTFTGAVESELYKRFPPDLSGLNGPEEF